MSIHLDFLLATTQANINLQSDRTLHKDVVWPAIASYEVMVRRLLMMFMADEALQSVTLASETRLVVEETEDSHLVKRYQTIRISAEGADTLRYETEKLQFIAQYVPTHRMGSGSFTLARNSREVAAILRDQGSGDADGWCWILAGKALKSFKDISIDLHIEQTVK